VEEAIEVDGLEGDDHFYILSTRSNVITTVIGGLGSDTFNVAGDVTRDVVSQNLDGLSSVINHGASSAPNTAYDKLLADGIAVTIATQTQGKVIIDQDREATSPGFTRRPRTAATATLIASRCSAPTRWTAARWRT
jgi:hypothetical protein